MFIKLFIPILATNMTVSKQSVLDNCVKWDLLIAETEETGKCFAIYEQVVSSWKESKIKVLKKCYEEEVNNYKEKKLLAEEKKAEIVQMINSLWLDMTIVYMMYSYDDSKFLLTFTANERVDFRALITKLAWKLKKRIQLLQIWARDRSKIIWGLWICWRELCCDSFLSELESVTMDAARDQNIAFKWPENLSWICGKLKCCLNYERALYKKIKKTFPKFGSNVKYEDKEWTIVWMDILNGKVKLRNWYTFINVELAELKK